MDLLRLKYEWADDLRVVSDEDDSDGINSTLLILEVELRPILYIRSLLEQLTAKEILKIWTEIAIAMNADRNDCIRLWSRLVKTFRELQDVSNELLEHWALFDQMMFLIPFDRSELILDYDDYIVNTEPEEELKRSQSVESTAIGDILETVPLKFDYAMDNEELFLLSFAPNMTRMTTKQNALARLRILEELFKLEFEDE